MCIAITGSHHSSITNLYILHPQGRQIELAVKWNCCGVPTRPRLTWHKPGPGHRQTKARKIPDTTRTFVILQVVDNLNAISHDNRGTVIAAGEDTFNRRMNTDNRIALISASDSSASGMSG
jgi:hypothetical protein